MAMKHQRQEPLSFSYMPSKMDASATLRESSGAWPWRSAPPTVAKSVESRLFSELESGPLFVLVDPLGGQPDLDIEGLPRFALNAQWLRLVPDTGPYLVQVENRHAAILAQTVNVALQEQLFLYRHGEGALRVGGWLQHKHGDGAALAVSLSQLFKLERSAFGASSLRLADRRVLEMLHRTCVPPGSDLSPLIDWPSQLGQDIACWIYLDSNMQIRAVRGKPEVKSGGALRVPESYWCILGRSAQLNEILARWHYHVHPLPEDALDQALFWLRRSERERPDWSVSQHVEHVVARLPIPVLPEASLGALR